MPGPGKPNFREFPQSCTISPAHKKGIPHLNFASYVCAEGRCEPDRCFKHIP
ncbi:hypothetical protein K437DRAFT_259964 [Tilletiaria anomala UBC 951]|uniref:Uncharacterized protein n=1 Tax=Tilletiaria anomala (strain ATCC 24038 / CBS 436.72 / UBC 951) TaxID=1037660 RepID=A0A066V5G6_TILAU|nr:uncharacterized protein K437DRAFT_259964 [Tilletiaria anomala UBC 951]KDN36977.1 hypothetical protein K437DRAFT_259964 [Tilletiaria anomala UBC 951]